MRRTIEPVVLLTVALTEFWALCSGHCASAADLKTLAIMLPEEPTDFGWNQQAFDAAKTVAAKYHLIFMPAAGLGYGDVRGELRELADDGASLIIAHASGYNTAAPEIGAEKHVSVAIVDRPKDSRPGAVADYTLSGREGAYLAGVLAGEITRTHVVAIVVAAESPPWNSQSVAFAQGVRATDPSVKVLYAVIGPAAYADAPGGRRVTESVIGAGADVVFGQGDRASFGMMQAAETKPSIAGGKVWFIDEIGDKTAIDKGHLLSSVIWNLVPIYSAMIEDLKAGKFGTHAYTIQLRDDSVRLLHSKYIPDTVWADIQAARTRIINGQVKVDVVWDAVTVREQMTAVAAPK
jgi:basic membrane protein A